MWIVVPIFAVGAGFLYLARTLETQGFYWAYRVCRQTWGLCGYSEWLLLVAGLLLVSYFILGRRTA